MDPGDEWERIQQAIGTATANTLWLIHTHAHFDHVGATRPLAEYFEAQGWTVRLALHPGDLKIYENLKMQGTMFGMPMDDPRAIDHWLQDEEELQIGELKFQVIHTPGHSPGGVCYRWEHASQQTLFSGDTLFDHSVGRSDLWGGDGAVLSKSIRNRLFTLDDDTRVIPGHGPDTRIGIEKRENPFLV